PPPHLRMTMPKQVFIKNYGCQMNVYDGARIAELMAPLGYTAATSPDDADLVILNTCHIREKAAQKVFSDLGHIPPLNQKRPPPAGEAGAPRRTHARRGGRLCRPGGGRGNYRAGSRCRHRRRTASLSPAARDGGAGDARARRRHELSGRAQIRPSAAAPSGGR